MMPINTTSRRFGPLFYFGLCLMAVFGSSVHGAALELRGHPIQGGLLLGKLDPGSQVYLDGEPLMISEDGVFLVAFGRDHGKTSELTYQQPDGTRGKRTLPVKQREYQIQRIDGLPPNQVTPPQDVLDRISNDARRVRQARARSDQRLDFIKGFVWPAEGPISGVYGSQRILNGEPRRPHFGVDVAGPTGTPVYAPADGVITLADTDQYYSGGTIILDHGHQLSSTFLHLSSVDVEVGATIKKGELIGRIGASGRATGPHLDWRMNWRNARIDPQLVLETLKAE